MNNVQRGVQRVALVIASMALVITVGITLFDIVGRRLGVAFAGTFELGEFLFVFIVASTIIYTSLVDAHISIDFLVNRLSGSKRLIASILTRLLVLFATILIAWVSFSGAIYSLRFGESYFTLGLSLFIPKLVLFFCFALFALGEVLSLNNLFRRLLKKNVTC